MRLILHENNNVRPENSLPKSMYQPPCNKVNIILFHERPERICRCRCKNYYDFVNTAR